MKIDFKKIINIKNKSDLKDWDIDKPIFQSNYLFHYLIIVSNLEGLKLEKFPIHRENSDGLNGFHLAAKEGNIMILNYLIKEYPDYIYNRTEDRNTFLYFLPIEMVTDIIKKNPKLDWDTLIEFGSNKDLQILKNLIYNLNYNDLKEFLNVYKMKPKYDNQYLLGIMWNTNLKTSEKIHILDRYTDEELNIKNVVGGGIIFAAINQDDIDMFNYLLKRNVDLSYYTMIKAESPLYEAIYKDIINNKYLYTKKILEKIESTNLETFNRLLDNVLHTLFYIRSTRAKQTVPTNTMISYEMDMELINRSTDKMWNHMNTEKHSPFDIVVFLDYDVYQPMIQKKKIKISKEILKKIDDDDLREGSPNRKWIRFLNTLETYIEPINEVNINEEKYSHSTLFQAKFKDVGIFSLYLADKYKSLYVPNMTSYMVDNITFDDGFPFSDKIIAKTPVFPWVVGYMNENEYYIHPYLNNLINAERREDGKRFALVFISVVLSSSLHANILLYDFKNMTVERFEPYGNTTYIDSVMDDILEEELTWSTGLKYIRPSDYEPMVGFQTISNENEMGNMKSGDFGGFCLAWCLWWVENRLKNPEIKPNILIEKLINKLTKSEYKFSENIRNYANKINEKRIKYMEMAGLDKKIISNMHISDHDDIKLTDFLIKQFTNLKEKS
jgi:hypothetical protein